MSAPLGDQPGTYQTGADQPGLDPGGPGQPGPGQTIQTVAPVAPIAPTAPVAAVVVKRKNGSSGGAITLVLAAMVAAAGIAFAVGRLTAPAQAATGAAAGAAAGAGGGTGTGQGGNGTRGSFAPGASGAPGFGGAGGRGGFGGFGAISVHGTVSNVTASGLDVTTSTGMTIHVATDGTTTYHAQAPAASSDVKNGAEVVIEVSQVRGPGGGGAPGAPALGSPAPSTSPGGAGTIPATTAKDITVVKP